MRHVDAGPVAAETRRREDLIGIEDAPRIECGAHELHRVEIVVGELFAEIARFVAADAVFAELDAAGIPARATFLAALQAIERTVASIAPSPGDDGEPS